MSVNNLSHEILGYIGAHPNWAAFVIGATAFGESFVFLSLLFPGTAILIAAGGLVTAHTLDPTSVIVAAILGATLGDAVSFWIGQRFGPSIPRLWPFRTRPWILARGIDFFRHYGWASVFVGRFFGPLRAVVPLVAGMLEMPKAPFYTANFLSAVIWAPALLFSGVLLGHVLASGWSIEDKLFAIALLIAALVVLGYWTRRMLHLR